MRLATKIFLSSSVVIVVLALVGVLSLRAVDQLVSVNREIATQSVPALRLTVALRDALATLARAEARFVVLQDAQYATAWAERAAQAGTELTQLAKLVAAGVEREHLEDAARAFARYRALVAEEHELVWRGRRAEAQAIVEGEAREVFERADLTLVKLLGAIDGRVTSAQAEASVLEARTLTGVLVALISAVGLALVATGVLAYRMTESLRTLSVATEAVAGGIFPEPVPVRANDEIGRLTRSFNTMAAELRRVQETKEEFFAAMSHELKSPLTSVKEAAQLLRDGVPGPLNPKQGRLVDIIAASCERQLGLVIQILELSRIRAGVLELARAPLDLHRTVARALEELRSRAEEAGVGLVLERVGGSLSLVGDEDRLVQVVVNLVANALRFTPRGGRVTVRVIDAGPEVELQVEDTGAGIPADALPRIFELYQQAHPGGGGTGLGLSIVLAIARAHGGRVTAESQEGKGSRFSVLLPRRGVAA